MKADDDKVKALVEPNPLYVAREISEEIKHWLINRLWRMKDARIRKQA